MTTGLQHPLVRDYLVRLDAALQRLPAAQAAELREQIVAHLDDAVAGDALDDDVRSQLRGLGEPLAVVAEASGSARHVRRRIRKRTLAILCAIALVLIGSIVFAERWRKAGSLECDCAYSWDDPIDRDAQVDTSADGHRQTTVPIRPNATQGFDLQLTNRTGVTQTILGWAPVESATVGWQANPAKPTVFGPFEATRFTMRFSPGGNGSEGFVPKNLDDRAPVSIRPGGFRTLSVTWPTAALPCQGAGDASVIDTISLRVRVGWFTRTEVIALPEAFAITGRSGTCPPGF